jgi:hypothetical protein
LERNLKTRHLTDGLDSGFAIYFLRT